MKDLVDPLFTVCTVLGLIVPFAPAEGVTVQVTGLNVAVTVWAEFIVTVHVPVPEQPPDQPVKVDPEAGAAVSVTGVPELYE